MLEFREYHAVTLLVPDGRVITTGGTVIVDFKVEFPGEYTLVDHALSRGERGLAGTLIVTGEADPEIYDGEVLHPGGH